MPESQVVVLFNRLSHVVLTGNDSFDQASQFDVVRCRNKFTAASGGYYSARRSSGLPNRGAAMTLPGQGSR